MTEKILKLPKADKKLTRAEIDELVSDGCILRDEALRKGYDHDEVYTALALYVAARSHRKAHQKSNGAPYYKHPQHVAERFNHYARPHSIKQKAYLHDVLEDTGLSINDLRAMGFNEDVLEDVFNLSKMEGESYLDFLVRAGECSMDVINIKIEDMRHNSDPSRSFSEKKSNLWKQQAYKVGIAYLEGIKSGEVIPGISMTRFICEIYIPEVLMKMPAVPDAGNPKAPNQKQDLEEIIQMIKNHTEDPMSAALLSRALHRYNLPVPEGSEFGHWLGSPDQISHAPQPQEPAA